MASRIFLYFKLLLISLIIGSVGGVVGSVFHICIDFLTEVRLDFEPVIWFLPLGGFLVALIYKICKGEKGINTDCVIKSAQTGETVPFKMTPLIFAGTVLTHFVGGSAGREGAALQLGGSIGYNIGKIFSVDEKQRATVVKIGMSAVFSALFQTPVTALFFALEVSQVGIMNYEILLPCFISSFTGYKMAQLFKIPHTSFEFLEFPEINVELLLKCALLAVLCGLVSALFCKALKKSKELTSKYIKNTLLRGFIGGCLILVLTLLVGSQRYNGAGMDVVFNSMKGNVLFYDFILKMIFTVVSISFGFKGGEIVPSFFIGATLGCIAAPLIGIPASVGASIGFICLFCGAVKCPVASFVLAMEMFGGKGVILFALCVIVSYICSGKGGLYKTQKIFSVKS